MGTCMTKTNHTRPHSPLLVQLRWLGIVTAFSALLLGGCGGGSSNTATAVSSPSNQVDAQTSAALSFAGFAATGAGIVNAPITFKCMAASPGTTTQAGGMTSDTARYQVTMPADAKLPCVVRVLGPLGLLHAAVDKNHTNQDVNITPLTDMQLSAASSMMAGNYFDIFDDKQAVKISGAAMAAAKKEVTDLFRPVVDLSGMKSFVSDTLVPALAGRQAGNQADRLLDQISAALATNVKSMTQVTSTLLEKKEGQTAAKLIWPAAPAPQSFTFTNPGSQTLSSAPSTLSAVTPAGLAVTFISSTPTICTVSGTSLTLVSAGSCTVTASQTGSANSAPASVVHTFTVNLPAEVSTETQTLACLSGQVGAIAQQRTVTTTNGVATNSAWTTTSNTCAVPPLPRSCVSQTLSWTAGGNTCTAAPITTQPGVTATATDSIAPTTGSASFMCTDGNWGIASSASCVAPIVAVTTETQTLACLSGQVGAIAQQRTVTTTNGVATSSAWTTTSNTCAAPPPLRMCVSQTLSWTSGGNTCTAAPATTESGVSATATDSTRPTTGSTDFFCTNGNWGAPRNPTCNAAAPSLGALTPNQASRMLTQATFGPTVDSVTDLTTISPSDWLTQQMAIPARADYVNEVQYWFDKGSQYHPGNGGDKYGPGMLQHKYWSLAVNAPDQLRQRISHSLLQIFVVSLEDSNLYDHARSFGQYMDNLNKHAFGNYRDLLQDVALSPVMGIYLSHMRNRKADIATGRVPDENFAREIMQLFTIGLHQLNLDGTEKLDGNGKPIETYTNDDVVGLARVFTGWSWDMSDSSDNSFTWGGPERYLTTGAARYDLKPMRVYPNFHETGPKSFLGVNVPANTDGNASLRTALDTLFNHPNVGPFIGKQLIQRLVTSNPSPAYVQFVAQAFNNNGSGVRGDMAAVIRAVLLYSEARAEPAGQSGKLREPALRITQAMRALNASSLTGRWLMGWNERSLLQSPLGSPSVFNFYRPGYVPPNTQIASMGMVAPEFQITNETTVVEWVNYISALVSWGTGWTGTSTDIPLAQREKADVTINFASTGTPLGRAASLSDVVASNAAVVDHLNLLLFSGRMSTTLRGQILDALQNQVGWNGATRQVDRLRIATFIALTSSEYLIER